MSRVILNIIYCIVHMRARIKKEQTTKKKIKWHCWHMSDVASRLRQPFGVARATRRSNDDRKRYAIGHVPRGREAETDTRAVSNRNTAQCTPPDSQRRKSTV